MMAEVVLIGGGGHAKCVIATLQAAGRIVRGAIDDDPRRHGGSLLGVPILSTDGASEYADADAIIAIGDNRTRQRIAMERRHRWTTAVHPRSWVHDTVGLGAGTVVFVHATVQPDTVIGRHAIVNTAASIDHDCKIGQSTHVGPGAVLAGGVVVGDGTLIGAGAVVCPNVRIGDWCIIGAGAVVTQDVPSGSRAIGVPARADPLPEMRPVSPPADSL